MRIFAVGAVAAALLTAWGTRSARAADPGPFGLGLIIGSPTGLSLKYYLGESGHAIDAAVGQAVASDRGIHVHADYLWHPGILASEDAFDLVWYVGIGVRLLDHDRGNRGEDDFHIGPRAPIGILFDFNEVPLDVFLELALILDFRSGEDGRDDHDEFGFDLNAGIGVRYYF